MAGTPVPTGSTTASSGNTSATGLLAQNNVSNTSVGAVQVAGANQAPVSARSSSSVDVRDTAASGAASGAAWAVANGAAGSPSGVATPGVTAAVAPTSGAASSTGATAQTSMASALSATVTLPGGPNTTPQAVSVSSSQVVNVTQGGAAAAVSAPVVATGAGAATDAHAASGSTTAVGLSAQNTVSTNANVSVHVAGQNFAPIQVIVDSVTRIFNLGVASSTSGDVTAGSGGSGAPAQAVASGSAQATGAQLRSAVDLRSSAAVRVNGDNYNPIKIVLNLAANLVNWGVGLARSGDAQADGGGGAATSGSAAAYGLQVVNLVTMWADASVDIEGNNFAPILVKISFLTTIDNRGVAGASSGNVAAGHVHGSTSTSSKSAASGSSTGAGQSTASGLVGSASKAISGDATALSNSVDAHVQSTQLSSANGSKPIAALTIAQMLRNLPPGSWDPFLEQSLPADSTPAVEAGLVSRSGNALASGLVSQVDQINTQLVACKDPRVSCVAANLASLSIVAQDGKTNPATRTDSGEPGRGGVQARSGGALANATPTPTASPKTASGTRPSASVNGASSSSSARGARATAQRSHHGARLRQVADLGAGGHLVLVDLWDQWPGRRLPPMPNPRNRAPTTTNVSVSLEDSPAWSELPLPDPLSVGAEPVLQARPRVSGPRTSGGLSRLASDDVAANDPEEFPVMQIVDVEPWPLSKNLEMLPMPSQALPPVASEPRSDELLISAEPDDAGVSPVELGLAVMLSVLGGLFGLRRRRLIGALQETGGLIIARLVTRNKRSSRIRRGVIDRTPTWRNRRLVMRRTDA
jgi:hypothetical protein